LSKRSTVLIFTDSLLLVNIGVQRSPLPRRRIAAPAVVFDARNLWRRRVSPLVGRLRFAASRQAPILRIAVHPDDLYEPAVRRTLVALLREALADRIPMTYGDLAGQLVKGPAVDTVLHPR
jgi:hypothetical protein